MIYLHGAEGETREMDLLGKGLSSVTRTAAVAVAAAAAGEERMRQEGREEKGEEMRNVFFEWDALIHSRSRARKFVRTVFAPIRPMNSPEPGFRISKKRVRCRRDLFRPSTDLGR